jgi:molecular chaperone GrpE (heat shock protein)
MIMEDTLRIEPTTDEAAELQAGIKQVLAEIELLRKQMRSDQADIERSRTRTRAMLADLSAQLRAA